MTNNNFVPAIPQKPAPPSRSEVILSIEAPLTSTQHTEIKTSHQDRAWGFLITTVPLNTGFGLVVVSAVVAGWGIPVWSLAALSIFGLAFMATWLIAFGWSLQNSPENIAMLEAREKWKLLNKERDRFWEGHE